jgi:uncharacterized membrane protein YuzA (DUF378 family)
MKSMSVIDMVAMLLVVVGGLNWGLVGAFHINVVELILGGADSIFARVVYVLVGLAAVYMIYGVFVKGKGN